MATNMNFINLHVRAAAGSVTGSIQRVCAGDESNASTITDWVTGNFKSLKYDDGTTADITGSQNDVHQQGTTDIDIIAGSCVDGSFIAIGTDADTMLNNT